MSLSTVDAFKHIHSGETVTLTQEELAQLQSVLLDILADIADVCDRHGITYELGDINMPRADYDRFIPIFRQEMGEKYWIHTPQETDNYGLMLSRILKKGTSVRTREDFQNPECGAFVDIFVIENTFDNTFLRTIHAWLHGVWIPRLLPEVPAGPQRSDGARGLDGRPASCKGISHEDCGRDAPRMEKPRRSCAAWRPVECDVPEQSVKMGDGAHGPEAVLGGDVPPGADRSDDGVPVRRETVPVPGGLSGISGISLETVRTGLFDAAARG